MAGSNSATRPEWTVPVRKSVAVTGDSDGPGIPVASVDKKPARQKRATTTRVRTGCNECRRRRIKCDENLPSCKRCVTSGLICHNLRSVWSGGGGSMQHRPSHQIEPIKTQLVIEPRYETLFFSDQQERQFFRAFLLVCEQGQSMPLLDILILTPQMAHEHTAVREISCAIGGQVIAASQHGVDSGYQKQMAAAHVHYSRAVAAIRNLKMAPENLLAAIVASLLFVSFEMYNDDIGNAVVHFKHLYRLMSQYIGLKCTETGLQPEELELSSVETGLLQIVQGLASLSWARGLAVELPQGWKASINIRSLSRKGYTTAAMPSKFADTHEAACWWNVTRRYVRDGLTAKPHVRDGSTSQERTRTAGRNSNSSDCGQYITAMRRWRASFSPLLEEARSGKHQATSQYLRATALEILHLEMLTRVYRIADPRNRAILPSVTPLYLDIVRSVQMLARVLDFSGPDGNAAEHTVIRPLAFVLRQCHDEAVLRELRDLLNSLVEICPTARAVLGILTADRGDTEGIPLILRGCARALELWLASCACDSEDIEEMDGEVQQSIMRFGHLSLDSQ